MDLVIALSSTEILAVFGSVGEHCAKCAEICHTVAILKDDENKHLEFSQVDCLVVAGVLVCVLADHLIMLLCQEKVFYAL